MCSDGSRTGFAKIPTSVWGWAARGPQAKNRGAARVKLQLLSSWFIQHASLLTKTLRNTEEQRHTAVLNLGCTPQCTR